jgi:hypothetical protein
MVMELSQSVFNLLVAVVALNVRLKWKMIWIMRSVSPLKVNARSILSMSRASQKKTENETLIVTSIYACAETPIPNVSLLIFHTVGWIVAFEHPSRSRIWAFSASCRK